MRELRGILFDSGGTLVGPVGGRWNPRFDFEDVLLRHVPDAPVSRFPTAFAAGEDFLNAATGTPHRDDYHRVILDALGIEVTAALLAELDAPLDRPVLEPFPEVAGVLTTLRDLGIRMAIVTDSWGTSDSVLAGARAMGFDCFEACAVSEELGCNKPDPRMYHHASDALGLEPHECLFVDDDPALVAAAIDLGYAGAAICRGDDATATSRVVPVISSLEDVVDLVHRSRRDG